MINYSSLPDIVTHENVNNDIIDLLIKMPKFIENKRLPSFKDVRANWIRKFDLLSEDARFSFTMRISVSKHQHDSYSIILNYNPPNMDTVILLRCNGAHQTEESRNIFHSQCHIHRISEGRWKQNVNLSPHSKQTEAADYTDIQSAILFFINYCNVTGNESFFEYNGYIDSKIRNDKYNSKQLSFQDFATDALKSEGDEDE